jgi:glycosyltransferase involved in cell wall biosynthesis
MIKLSIIIPTYGRVNKILLAIESALVDSSFEVIVVDDNGKGSEHQLNTQDVLSGLISNERFSYYPLENNSGAGTARNYGVDKARGKYITFLDDDDFFIDNALQEKLEFFKNQNNEFEICCSHMRIERDGVVVKVGDERFVGNDAKSFLLNGSCYTSMIMIKKESLVSINGFFDTPYLQDHTLMLKAFLNDYKVCLFDEDVFVHTLHDEITITTGKRPIAGVALRCDLEKQLAKKQVLTKSENSAMQYRWNTIIYHTDWINKGRTIGLFSFLINKLVLRATTRLQVTESFKLLVKFFVKYQYYCK